MSDDSRLDALLESLSNRERVDWARAEADSPSPQERSRVRALRDVARLAQFHESLHGDGANEGGGVGCWGDLILLERVGAGANGEVYRAWDPALQREVALKLIRDPGGTAGWLEEARALARVRNPHVVAVYGAAENEGLGGLWVVFVRGPTLEREIARNGRLSSERVARLGGQIARALEAAHAVGTVHRDVKPANIVLEAEERAVLTDFGLGRRAAGSPDGGAFSGTPLFMSPQRLAGAKAKASDDLYALGVTLRWSLTGSPPFRAESLDGLRVEVQRGPGRALRDEQPDAPSALVSAVDRAMAPDPAARWASAAELAAALEAVAREPVAGVGTGAPRRDRRRLWMAGTLVMAAALAWLGFARFPARGTSVRTTPTPSPAVPSDAYDVTAGFLRRDPKGDVRLVTGDRVAPGDRLSLEFRSTRPVWVYVVNADERGESYLLFPQPMFDLRNPLPADSVLRLPGMRAGRESGWMVTSRGGREHLLVVANLSPISDLEAEIARLPAPVPNAPVRYTRIPASTIRRLRGVGGVSDLPPGEEPVDSSRLLERIRSLAGSEQAVRGTWVRQVVLENPIR